jgi:hypothetical protein
MGIRQQNLSPLGRHFIDDSLPPGPSPRGDLRQHWQPVLK